MLGNNIDIQVKEILKKFAEDTIAKAKANLSGRDDTGKLKDSLEYKIQDTELTILMEDYGKFVDEGVSGLKKKYDTPYKYNKMPNIDALSKYAKRKGMKLSKNATSYKSLGFLIARKLLNEGMKPSYFITKPYEENVKTLARDIANNIKL